MVPDEHGEPAGGRAQATRHELLPFVIAIIVVVLVVVIVAAVTGKQVSNVFSNISNGLFAGSG